MYTSKRKVVVTGLGAVTPLGNSMPNTWAGVMEGVSQCGPVHGFDASGFPTTIGYEVRGFSLDRRLVEDHEEGFLSRAAEFGVSAAAEALKDAGLSQAAGDERAARAVCLGVGMCSPDFEWHDKVFIPRLFSDENLRHHLRFFPDQLSSVVGRLAGAGAGITTVHTACASSGQSLGEAYQMVACGDADVVVTGGADSMIHPFYFAGFSLLGALSKRNGDPRTASRPFDQDRDGFVLGEGACMLVFEEESHARRRGARIYGEVCGYGVTESAYRITDLHPEGTGPIEAMQMAIADAGIRPQAIGYINAHGTSTLLNDRIEALAVAKVFNPYGHRPRVSSTKSMTGHMISAAGAIEFAIALLSVSRGVLPPSVNVFSKDPECDIDLTAAEPVATDMQYALSNSVGFGGSNTALIAGRCQI